MKHNANEKSAVHSRFYIYTHLKGRIILLLLPVFFILLLCQLSAEEVEQIIVFGEYPVVQELEGGVWDARPAGSAPLIQYERGAEYREKALVEALHFLSANVYGYTFVYKPGSTLMKIEETFDIGLRGEVPGGAAGSRIEGVFNNIYRVKLNFTPTRSVQSWRAAFRTNTIRLAEAEGTSEFFTGWEGRNDAYREALRNLVLVSAKSRVSSKPLLLKGDILVEGTPVFSVGAGRHYCRLQGYVNFVEIITYD